MEFESFRLDMVRRFDILIFNIVASLFSVLVFRYRIYEPFRWKLTRKTKQMTRLLLKHDFRSIDRYSIDD